MCSTVISQHEIAPECVHAKEWECRSDLLRISVRTNPTASQRSVFCSRAFCYRLYLMRFHLYCSVMRQDKIIQRGLVCKWTTAIYVQLWDCTRAGQTLSHNKIKNIQKNFVSTIAYILVSTSSAYKRFFGRFGKLIPNSFHFAYFSQAVYEVRLANMCNFSLEGWNCNGFYDSLCSLYFSNFFLFLSFNVRSRFSTIFKQKKYEVC